MLYIVDDDPTVRRSLVMLVQTIGIDVREYATGEAFLSDPDNRDASCVVLDISMPGLTGLEVQARMVEDGMNVPVIFVTGHGDVPSAVNAMRNGAVDFLQKPFDDQTFLERVQQCICRGRELRHEEERRTAIEARLATLSQREREVLTLVVAGNMNKVIAAALGISTKTVEDHRASLMRKMQVRSVAELVRVVAASRRAPLL